MPTVSREQTRALEQGLKAPQVSPPTPLGSMMFQAFAQTANEIGAQQANLYQQEANQVLSLGLSYDEQTKRLSSLKGKYTFGLMTNPGAIIPTPSEQKYAQQMADYTNKLKESITLDEMVKRIQTANNFEAWEATRDELAGTLGESHSMDFRAKMNALTYRAKLDFSSSAIDMQQAMNEFANRTNNNFLNDTVNPTVADYEELMNHYANNMPRSRSTESKAFMSAQLAKVLQRAGSPEVVQAVAKKYKDYLTPEQVEIAVNEASKRVYAPDTADTLAAKIAAEARAKHILGVPLGVSSRFIQSDTERRNELLLTQYNLGFTAPERIEATEGPPIIGGIAAQLRDDLKSDPFAAVQKRGLDSFAPSALTLPGPDGSNIDKYKEGLKARLEQIYKLKNQQYALNEYAGTRYITHAHTEAELQALDATYEAASPETKARMALAEYRAIEAKNLEVKYQGQQMNAAEALPFKDKDAAKMLDLGLNDKEFTSAFTTWVRMKKENPGKAGEVLTAFIDTMNGGDPSASNVYDDYTGLAMYAAAKSGLNLLDLSVGLTGISRNELDPLSKSVAKSSFWSRSKKGNPSDLKQYNAGSSNLIVSRDSPIAKNIENTTITMYMKDRDKKEIIGTYKLSELLNSTGSLGDNNAFMPYARLKPEHGTSTKRFAVQVASSLEDKNAGTWSDLQIDGKTLYIHG